MSPSQSVGGTAVDIRTYRLRPEEQARIADLIALLPSSAGRSVLDVGARDGYISCLLTSSFEQVTALDLQRPNIPNEKVTAVQGDVTCLQFSDNQFDTVVCAEVLEHIPSQMLQKACSEIARVARHAVLIGVPFKQDTRIGRTKCQSCGRRNPPWGHVNTFDERRLIGLFPGLQVERQSFVGENRSRTNFLSVFLMDLAGNPDGTYDQEECCVFCNAKLKSPPERTFLQKVATKFASIIDRIQQPFVTSHPNWIHVRFSKVNAPQCLPDQDAH